MTADTGPNFPTRSDMDSFSATGSIAAPVTIETDSLTETVANGATAQWSISFTAASYYAGTSIDVYPVEATVSAPVVTTSHVSAWTLLPYWPDNKAAVPLQTAWVWPLVDTPQQGACTQTLASSGLSGLMSSGGRLSTLLDAGAQYSIVDDLTWDIDPALLSDASVMTRPYHTGGKGACRDRTVQPASPAATSWLAKLRTTTAGQPAFLAPYANVDVAALSHDGLDASIKSAYQVGRAMAGPILPGTFGPKGTGTTGGTALRAAWPAGGSADAETVDSLASDGGIRTVVLASGPPTSDDNALGRTTTDTGASVNVLRADSEITRLLGSSTRTASAKDQFATVQSFLAQTAMISAEEPNQSRSLVLGPPTDWNPTPAVAKALLRLTSQAPWLRPVGLSTLAERARRVRATRLPALHVAAGELSDSYLGSVQAAADSLEVFKSLLYQPPAATLTMLDAALAATESSAWRGPGQGGGGRALSRLTTYLRDSVGEVQIIASKKIFLTGTSGQTPVSVINGLDVPIQVEVSVTVPAGSQLQIGKFTALLPVRQGGSNTVRIPLHSASIGTTTVQLQLLTRSGSPLPGTAQPLSVEVTRFGRSLLIIIGGALGILVLTSVYRLRRKRRARATRDRTQSKAEETANAGGTG